MRLECAEGFGAGRQARIEPDIANAAVGILSKPGLRCGNDALALARRDRPGSILLALPRFHLHEHEQAAAACDDIDFADWASPAALQNPKAFRDKQSCCASFGRNPGVKRYPLIPLPIIRCERGEPGTVGLLLIAHSRAPCAGPARADRPGDAALRWRRRSQLRPP